MTEWQPMEKAPKDGSKILLYDTDYYFFTVAHWSRGAWRNTWAGDEIAKGKKLHFQWMPLPPEPPDNHNE